MSFVRHACLNCDHYVIQSGDLGKVRLVNIPRIRSSPVDFGVPHLKRMDLLVGELLEVGKSDGPYPQVLLQGRRRHFEGAN